MKDILAAHRVGANDEKRGRLMVVRCEQKTKQKILSNAKNLAKKTNVKGSAYYINPQVPEAIAAQKKNNAYQIAAIREQNISKPARLKTKYQIKNGKLYVDGCHNEKLVGSPQLMELFPDQQEQDKMEKIKFIYGDSKQEKDNVFTAVGAKVSSTAEVRRAYRRMKQVYPDASHISLGYDAMKIQGNNDDGEHGAGLCIEKHLKLANANNKAVFVVHKVSKYKLGPRRFQIIAELTQEILLKMKG